MINLIISCAYPFLSFYPFFNQYKIVQAHHYELDKYLKHKLIKNIFVQIINVVFLFISFFMPFWEKVILLIFSLILTSYFLYEKESLKLTNRVKRLLVIYFVYSFCFSLMFNDKVLLFSLSSSLLFVTLFITHFISCFVESLIMKRYVRDAKKIIKDKRIIGITGSYGKTSCKNILFDMLEGVINVSKTPKSYNNKVGIVKGIRECVKSEDEYFICEYGVDKKGGMDKLLKVIKPNVSLITEVGSQHILTFKNIDTIKNEKLKLAKVLLNDETCVLNNDNVYLCEEVSKLKCNVITYGIKNNSDIMAKNIEMTNKGSSFDLYINNKMYSNINICLLGEHNILNVLGSIGVLKGLGIEFENINELVGKIKPIEHRLELKYLQGIKIIDDGFNSNEVGFKNAIDVLNMMQEEKFIITPGIIEQGENSEKVNYELGKYMASKIDFAILVEKNANVFKRGLVDGGFSENKILIKKDFMEAWEYVKSIADENKIFLIENDLPSIYLR